MAKANLTPLFEFVSPSQEGSPEDRVAEGLSALGRLSNARFIRLLDRLQLTGTEYYLLSTLHHLLHARRGDSHTLDVVDRWFEVMPSLLGKADLTPRTHNLIG